MRAASADPLAFTVVVPVFDEERAVGPTLDAIEAVLPSAPHPHEIVVVDDGSGDGTSAHLRTRQGIRVVRHERRRGYGASLKTGIVAARHPIVVVIDADATYPATAIPSLVEACGSAQMAVGARIGPNVVRSPLRSAVKWALRMFAQVLCGASIPDLNSGLRAFRRTLAERYVELLPDGFSFTTTITVASLAERAAVRFIPIDYGARIGVSKLRPIPDTFRIARQLVRIGAHFAPARTAMCLGLPFLLLAVALWASAVLRGGGPGPWPIACAALAVVMLLGGLGRELQHRRSHESPSWAPPRA